jgi:hypothetical protein
MPASGTSFARRASSGHVFFSHLLPASGATLESVIKRHNTSMVYFRPLTGDNLLQPKETHIQCHNLLAYASRLLSHCMPDSSKGVKQ